MWLEVKILLSVFAMICIAIAGAALFYVNIVFAFVCFIAVFLVLFGDILIGYQIKHNHLDVLLDPCPAGYEICVLFDFSGNIDFIRTKKGPLGTREFVRYKKEANIINDGKYQVRFINGNHGFVGHESYDKNVDMCKAEAYDKLKGDTLQEVVHNLPLVNRQKKAGDEI